VFGVAGERRPRVFPRRRVHFRLALAHPIPHIQEHRVTPDHRSFLSFPPNNSGIYVEQLISSISDWVWGPPLLILLLGTHVLLTVRLRFIQRFIGTGIRISLLRSDEGSGDVSQFGALTTALAATIGTGNIVGVATAVASGGPGAVLWMWLTGVFGIATKYSEALLAVKFRVKTASGLMAGGPMYVLERGVGKRWLGLTFAALTAVSAFGIGNIVQANSIAQMVQDSFGVQTWITGLVLTGLTATVILGGIRSIARVCESLVPFMAFFYVVGCLTLLVLGWNTVPATFHLILQSAFTGHAMVGGFLGAGMKEAIRYGVARGLFSNESGLGSAPIVAAAAKTKNSVRQALVSSTGTFWDTVVVCAITGLVIVNSGEWINGATGAALTKAAFTDIPFVGPIILTVGLLTFVFSTILGWSYYGEKAAEYLWGSKVVAPYRWLWVVAVMVGSILSLPLVWSMADITNGLMAIPNLVSLLALQGVILAETKKYLWSGNLDLPGEE
jgi:AGCS family alanine or glycine:cation symporter